MWSGVGLNTSEQMLILVCIMFYPQLPQLGPKFLMVGGVTLVGGCFVLLAWVDGLDKNVAAAKLYFSLFLSPPSFVIYMSPLNFIIFSCLLRAVEGVGSAMYFTSSFAVVAALFPSNLGFVMVIAHNCISFSLCQFCLSLSLSLSLPLPASLSLPPSFIPFLSVSPSFPLSFSLFLPSISLSLYYIFQGLMELSSGIGFAVGPPLGGLLYYVSTHICLYHRHHHHHHHRHHHYINISTNQ